jgi:hypothetical protein
MGWIFLILVSYLGYHIGKLFFEKTLYRICFAPVLGGTTVTPIAFLLTLAFKNATPDPLPVAGWTVFGALVVFLTLTYKAPLSEGLNNGWKPVLLVAGGALLVTAPQVFRSLHHSDGRIWVQGFAWSDLVHHLATIATFAKGANYPPTSYGFPGEPLNYHYLFYFFTAITARLGADPVAVLNCLTVLGFVETAVASLFIGRDYFKSQWVGVLAFLMVCFGSSLVVWKELFVNHQSLTQLFSISGWLSDSVFERWALLNFNVFNNQRHFAFGLGQFALGALLLVRSLASDEPLKRALFRGCFIGVLPFFHMNVAISLVCAQGGVFLLQRRRGDLVAVCVASGLVVIQGLLWKAGGSNAVGAYPMVHYGYELDSPNVFLWLSYYFKVVGLKLACGLCAVFIVPRHLRGLFLSTLPVFILPNIFQFSSVLYDNNKFLILWIFILGFYASWMLFHLVSKTKIPGLRVGLVILAFCVMNLTGIVDYLGVLRLRGTYMPWRDDGLRMWIEKHTAPDAVFVSDYVKAPYYEPRDSVMLSGRRLFVHDNIDTIKATAQRKQFVENLQDVAESQNLCLYSESEDIQYILLPTTNPKWLNLKRVLADAPKAYGDSVSSVYSISKLCNR